MNIKDQQVVFHVFTTLSELTSASSENNISKFLAKNKIPPLDDDEDNEKKKGECSPSQQDADELFTVKSAANYLLASENSVREWLKKGYIKYIRIGKRIRIRKAEILAMEKRRSP